MTSRITILVSSLEYSSDLLLHELCQLDNVEIMIYDVDKKSDLGVLGSKLAIQASALYPRKKIVHSSDLEESLKTDLLINWGLYFSGGSAYNAVYREFFSGKFKDAVVSHRTTDQEYGPDVLFLRSNSSGLKAATILGREVPQLKEKIYVLDSVSNEREQKVYPKSDGSFRELAPLSPDIKQQVDNLQNINGGMLDVDVLVTCVKGILFNERSPREIIDYVGVFPTEQDKTKYQVKGNTAIFLPDPEKEDYLEELRAILPAEEASLNTMLK